MHVLYYVQSLEKWEFFVYASLTENLIFHKLAKLVVKTVHIGIYFHFGHRSFNR